MDAAGEGGEVINQGDGNRDDGNNSSDGGGVSDSSSVEIIDGNVVNNNDEMPYENWALPLADEPLPDSVLNVMAQVLHNDMLVENILEKIILENDRASIRYCRLVSKQWLCAIAKLYRKMKRPQFIVNTNKDTSLLNEPRPRPFFEQHTLLYEFIKPMARHDRIEGFIPTFSLHLGASYFRKSNYTDFVNCLVQCGPSLVELYIRFPKNSAMSFLLPPTISLPNLNTFGVSFSAQSLLGHPFPMPYHHQQEYFPNNCSIHLVQNLLNAASNLRRLQFMSCPNPMNPPDMENLYLPDTLSSICIDTPFRDFELFLRKSLPYLTEIRINATIALYSEETIFDLFSKLCPTLRTVWLTGSAGTRRSLPIRLPRMEYLTKFVMFKPWEFEERNPPISFEETFPALETLVFANQTEYSFSYLMSGMRSTTVTSFCVWLTSLRPHPPVMNFPPVGLPVGEDHPNANRPIHVHLHHEYGLGNLQERRERMRHALQQMRLDIMERHHLRRRPLARGEDGPGPGAAAGNEAPVPNQEPMRPPPFRRVAGIEVQRPVLVPIPRPVAVEERDRRNLVGIQAARLYPINNNNNNNNNNVDVEERDIHLPRWLPPPRRDAPEQMEQERYRYMAHRARLAWEHRQRIRERRVAAAHAHANADGGIGIHGGPHVFRVEGDEGFPRQEDGPPPLGGRVGVQVVIERVRPPYDADMVLNQHPRVVIRRIDALAGRYMPPPPILREVPHLPLPLQPPPAHAPIPAALLQARRDNNVPGGDARPGPAPPGRAEEQNPIRAVFRHMLDRMEVDREEEDNAINREQRLQDLDDFLEGRQRNNPFLQRIARNNADPDVIVISDSDSDDSDNEVVGDGGMVRRLEVLAAAAVVNQQPGENNQDNGGRPAAPQQIEERPEAERQGEVHDAVREAFRVIRENDEPLPNPGNAPPPSPERIAPADPNNRNNNEGAPPPGQAPAARPPPAERNNEDVDEVRAAIGGVRRRLRQQEARNLRDLRQLRQRMLMDWGHPVLGRHVPLGGGHVPLPDRPVTMTKDKMQSINIAFPNLVKLTINISGPETCGLKYIFEEMRSLQSLRIIVENSLWTIKWDSLLTGIPSDFCDAVRSSQELWDEVYLNENHVSIRNMTKLEELMILECIKTDEQRDIHRSIEEHYISDVAFHFGLLKMKELKHLYVTPGFAPSNSMYKKWYDEKGYKIKVRPRAKLDVSYHEHH